MRRYLLYGIVALAVAGSITLFSFRENDTAEAQTIYTACESRTDVPKESCYAEEFQTYALEHGSAASFAVLRELQGMDPDAIGCHFIAHGIGYGAYKRDPASWEEAFRSIPQECTYGGMHGILEIAVSAFPKGLTGELIPDICGQNPRGDCNHIIGHLTLIEAMGDVDGALSLCNALPEGVEREFCYGGAFMEEITSLNLIKHDLADLSALDWPARVPELMALCQSYNGTEGVACWTEFAHAAAAAADNDARGTFALCANAQTKEMAAECQAHAIGILGGVKQFDLLGKAAFCREIASSPAFEDLCHSNLIASALSTEPDLAENALAYCASVPDVFKRSCFGMIGSSLAGKKSPEEITRLCARVSPTFRNFCETGPKQFYFHKPVL